MPAPLRKVVLDVLKPIRGPSIIDVSREVAALPGIEGVNITVKEIDVETVTLTMTIEGSDIDYGSVEKKLEELGCIVHSIDQAVAGKKIVEQEEVEQGE
ncbi:conserved hypothetical protein [Aeropyrum pernix K1]|uniref:DUF211 domain-containing protein n=4 Tax=Aeropyrum TaxID=56635 RepID=Q9YE91_AERPE|nr:MULTISPECIES: DUF211 domain-containing protein [Aeropyrum]BAA79655.2 conserved hypothetical protein [Aeropyrum pernix K1]BAN89973.1 uncharacterized protein conserved in archaea [Aeropyrum camini SY1 = JCM 12091]